jgi:prophage regulatory protein
MKLLSTRQVTDIIGRSPLTLRRWWKSGSFPKPLFYNNRTLGWSEKDIQQWLMNKNENS